jgi:hypothetical protein
MYIQKQAQNLPAKSRRAATGTTLRRCTYPENIRRLKLNRITHSVHYFSSFSTFRNAQKHIRFCGGFGLWTQGANEICLRF